MTRTALIVVDLQNDFCTGPAATARYRKDPARLDEVTTNAARAVDLARDRGVEVVFVRFVGDEAYQGPSWRRRNERKGRAATCVEGSWGARFHKVAPAPGEFVVTKRACFDAFLAAGFEEHLRRQGIGHLVLAGVYADVCVDSTARTAFQKGWHITLLVDCTTSLLQRDEDTVRFMAELYGARTTTHDRPDTWCGPVGREDERCSVTASR
ncbi:cysteine hydrolase family protein [Actinosynnema sp. NPDC059335]|uniref:cysteine hydrolase family protein n=1 Tax=Actinosynnema sp. NPDC059335 TaxID=3346804 RepID=UPI00367218E0